MHAGPGAICPHSQPPPSSARPAPFQLIDFGFARALRPGERTFTLCGTVEYLAPEVVLGRGHAHGVDLWALGVLLYELLVGVTPFAADGGGGDGVGAGELFGQEHEMATCARIVKAKPRFPRSWGEEEQRAKELLKRLVAREPTRRLGVQAHGFGELKDHPWFNADEDLDFQALARQEPVAPWLPDGTGAAAGRHGDIDITHFAEWQPAEEVGDPLAGGGEGGDEYDAALWPGF